METPLLESFMSIRILDILNLHYHKAIEDEIEAKANLAREIEGERLSEDHEVYGGGFAAYKSRFNVKSHQEISEKKEKIRKEYSQIVAFATKRFIEESK